MPRTTESAIKVTEVSKDLIRYGAGVYEMTLAEFTDAAVVDYLDKHPEEVRAYLEGIAEKLGEAGSRYVAVLHSVEFPAA